MASTCLDLYPYCANHFSGVSDHSQMAVAGVLLPHWLSVVFPAAGERGLGGLKIVAMRITHKDADRDAQAQRLLVFFPSTNILQV